MDQPPSSLHKSVIRGTSNELMLGAVSEAIRETLDGSTIERLLSKARSSYLEQWHIMHRPTVEEIGHEVVDRFERQARLPRQGF